MSLLRPARNESAYLKMGNYGGAGSGKTWTSALVAIGLSSRVGDGKPVAYASRVFPENLEITAKVPGRRSKVIR